MIDADAVRAAWGASGLTPAPRWLDTVDSTQDAAARFAAEGAAHGTTVVAGVQTAGRGRRGRAWSAVDGGLAFSVILRPAGAPERLGWIPLATAVALREALDPRLGIKWPNDLLLPDGRKVAGVLAEAEVSGGRVTRVIVGVGVNRVAKPELPTAGALSDLGPVDPPATLLARCVAAMMDWTARDRAAVAAAWQAGCAHGGRVVSVAGREGVSAGLADDGGLRLRRSDGGIEVVHAGDVTLVDVEEVEPP